MLVRPASNTDSFTLEFRANLLHVSGGSWFHGLTPYLYKPKRVQIYYEPKRVHVNSMSNISERLREERKRLGLSQGKFADLLGIHRNTQARYERGEREPDTAYLQAIAQAGVDVSYVFGPSKWTPEKKLRDMLDYYQFGSTGHPVRDTLGNEIPWLLDGGGEEVGELLLGVLEISVQEWNQIAEKLIRLNESGVPFVDGRDPAWAVEIARASLLIRRLEEKAAALDSGLLADILESFDAAVSAHGVFLSAPKRAQAIAMLYRALKQNGIVDPAMIDEAVTLAAD